MGHLGAERVVELARERFFWPHMQRNIMHFVTKKCSCGNNRAPVKKTCAPLQNITTYMPLELVSLDFLHLELSTGVYEYILVIVYYEYILVTTLLVSHKRIHPGIKKHKLPQKKILSLDTDFQAGFYMIRDGNLRINYLINKKNCVGQFNREQYCITHRQR